MESRMFVGSGNELVAMAAIDCGCKFFGGYPITPSSEIAHIMSVELPKLGGTFIQMEDEISGISVALGASMSGTKAMTASSGPGISLKVEQIGYAFMAEIPLVIVDVMRGGPSTGLPTRVSQGDVEFLKHPTHGDFKSVTIAPSNLLECYTETIRAFNLAEELMTPVFLILDETIGHMSGRVDLPSIEEAKKSVVDRKIFSGDKANYLPYGVEQNSPAILNPFFSGYNYHITGLYHDDFGFPTENEALVTKSINRLFGKIDSRADLISKQNHYMLDDCDIAIFTYGSVALSARDAIDELRSEGVKVGMYCTNTIWPSPNLDILFDKRVIVVELNKGQYLMEVERILGKKVEFLGKANGRPIAPKEIVNFIKGAQNGI